MVSKKKKITWWSVIFGAIISGYIGYLCNGAWKPEMEITSFLESLNCS